MAQKQPVGMAVAKFDYKTNDSHELNISKGEKLTLLDDSQHWWQVMNSKGDTGFVPSNFCKKSKQGIFSSLRNTLGRKKSKEPSPAASCGVSSIGTAPSSAGGRRSLTASPKNINPNTNNGSIVVPNKNRPSDSSGGHLGSGNPFYSMGSLDSSGSNKPTSCELQKSAQSMSYNAGQQTSVAGDKQNQSRPNLPVQMPQYPIAKAANNDAPTNNTSFKPINGRNYGGGAVPKTKYQIGNCLGANAGPEQDQPRQQDPRTPGSSGNMGTSFSSTTGSLGPSAACVAKFSYTPCQPDELALSRGDKIKVLERSSDGWWRGELINTATAVVATGWFPSNYVTLERPQNSSGLRSATDSLGRMALSSGQHHSSMPSVTSGVEPRSSNHHHHNDVVRNNNPNWSSANQVQSPQRYSTVLTLYPFSKNQSEEMSFEANEILEVIERPIDDPDWWRCRNVNGEVGLVPRNYVKQLTSTEPLANKPTPSVLPQTAPIFEHTLYTPNSDSNHLRLSYNKSGRFKDKIWYWGNISRMECESLLVTHGYLGQFVVRDSESHPGDLTITMHAGGKCRNFKVHIDNGEYHIGQKMFNSIEILIQHYRTHPIYKSDSERLLLSDPFQYSAPTSSNF